MSMPLVSAYLYQSPLGQKGIRPPATVGRSVGEGAASGVFSQEPGDRQAQETTGGRSKFSLSFEKVLTSHPPTGKIHSIQAA